MNDGSYPDTGKLYSTTPVFAHTWSLNGPNGMIVSIDTRNGEVTLGPNVTTEKASRAFYEEVSRQFARAAIACGSGGGTGVQQHKGAIPPDKPRPDIDYTKITRSCG